MVDFSGQLRWSGGGLTPPLSRTPGVATSPRRPRSRSGGRRPGPSRGAAARPPWPRSRPSPAARARAPGRRAAPGRTAGAAPRRAARPAAATAFAGSSLRPAGGRSTFTRWRPKTSRSRSTSRGPHRSRSCRPNARSSPLSATSSAEAPVAGSGPAGTSSATTALRNSGWSDDAHRLRGVEARHAREPHAGQRPRAPGRRRPASRPDHPRWPRARCTPAPAPRHAAFRSLDSGAMPPVTVLILAPLLAADAGSARAPPRRRRARRWPSITGTRSSRPARTRSWSAASRPTIPHSAPASGGWSRSCGRRAWSCSGRDRSRSATPADLAGVRRGRRGRCDRAPSPITATRPTSSRSPAPAEALRDLPPTSRPTTRSPAGWPRWPASRSATSAPRRRLAMDVDSPLDLLLLDGPARRPGPAAPRRRRGGAGAWPARAPCGALAADPGAGAPGRGSDVRRGPALAGAVDPIPDAGARRGAGAADRGASARRWAARTAGRRGASSASCSTATGPGASAATWPRCATARSWTAAC